MSIDVSMAPKGDAGRIAQWIGEALANQDMLNSGEAVRIHRLEIEEADA